MKLDQVISLSAMLVIAALIAAFPYGEARAQTVVYSGKSSIPKMWDGYALVYAQHSAGGVYMACSVPNTYPSGIAAIGRWKTGMPCEKPDFIGTDVAGAAVRQMTLDELIELNLPNLSSKPGFEIGELPVFGRPGVVDGKIMFVYRISH